jgi:hypothetical protein
MQLPQQGASLGLPWEGKAAGEQALQFLFRPGSIARPEQGVGQVPMDFWGIGGF